MGEYTFRHTSDLFSCLSWTGSRQNGTSVCQVSTTHPDTNRIIILESELLLPQSLTQFLPMYYFKIQVSVCLLFIWSFDLARQFNNIQTYNLLNWRHKICTQVNKLSSWPCTPKCTCMYYIMILQTIFIFPRIKSLQEVY